MWSYHLLSDVLQWCTSSSRLIAGDLLGAWPKRKSNPIKIPGRLRKKRCKDGTLSSSESTPASNVWPKAGESTNDGSTSDPTIGNIVWILEITWYSSTAGVLDTVRAKEAADRMPITYQFDDDEPLAKKLLRVRQQRMKKGWRSRLTPSQENAGDDLLMKWLFPCATTSLATQRLEEMSQNSIGCSACSEKESGA